jgi:sulfite reductase (NADPH) flavoprotein alpha-component
VKKNIYKLHRLTGITLGVLLFFLAVSGVLITFRNELMPIVYSEFRVTPGQEEVRPEVLLQTAQSYLKDRRVTNLYAAEEPDQAALILYKTEGHLFPGILTMDPFSGKIIGEMSLFKNIFAVALFFHANFFLSKPGEYTVGFLGLVLIFFVISGFYIWLPKNNASLRLKKLLTFDRLHSQKIHHVLGLIFALPLLLSGATGFLTIYDLSYSVTRLVGQGPVRVEEMSLVRECDFSKDVDALKLVTNDQAKNLISIHLCNKKNAFMKVTYGLSGREFTGGYGRMLIDSHEQKIVQHFDSSKDPKSWNIKRLLIYPLHSGEYFGFIGKVIVLLSGFGLCLLFISGIRLVFLRKFSKRH